MVPCTHHTEHRMNQRHEKTVRHRHSRLTACIGRWYLAAFKNHYYHNTLRIAADGTLHTSCTTLKEWYWSAIPMGLPPGLYLRGRLEGWIPLYKVSYPATHYKKTFYGGRDFVHTSCTTLKEWYWSAIPRGLPPGLYLRGDVGGLNPPVQSLDPHNTL